MRAIDYFRYIKAYTLLVYSCFVFGWCIFVEYMFHNYEYQNYDVMAFFEGNKVRYGFCIYSKISIPVVEECHRL